jgi:hypothetical protein
VNLIANVSADTIWREAVDGLAEVLVVTAEEILAEVAVNGGDLAIKSKDAELVISYVEERLGDVELVDQSHLGEEELTSLRSLSRLMWQRWVELFGDGEDK